MIFSDGGASCSAPSKPNCPGICGTISTTFSSSATYRDVTTGLVGARVDLAVQLTVMVCRSSSGLSSRVMVSYRYAAAAVLATRMFARILDIS